MLSNNSKAKLAELAKKMRADASRPKESLTQKWKAPTLVTKTPTDKDEETTFGLVFKRKRKVTTTPTEDSHSDGRASHQDIIVIQECETESSRGKSLWDPNFDVPTYAETTFLPNEEKIGS